MARQAQTQNKIQNQTSLPILKWEISLDFKGEVKRPNPVTSYTLAGMLRSAMKKMLQFKYGLQPTPAVAKDKEGRVQSLRMFEVSPNCPAQQKLRASLEPAISLWGLPIIAPASAVGNILTLSEYTLILNFFRPRVKTAIINYSDEIAWNGKQGQLDDVVAVVTGNPHDVTLRHVQLTASVMLVPTPVDALKIPEFVEYLPNSWKSQKMTYYETYKRLLQETLEYLKENVIWLDAIGGRKIHVIEVEVKGPEEVGKVPAVNAGNNVWNSLLKKLQPYSLEQCHKQLLAQKTPQPQPRAHRGWGV